MAGGPIRADFFAKIVLPSCQNSEGRRRGFRLKFRGTSSPNVKLKGDFGSQTEVVRFVDRFAF
jgi:hypothetical protein